MRAREEKKKKKRNKENSHVREEKANQMADENFAIVNYERVNIAIGILQKFRHWFGQMRRNVNG